MKTTLAALTVATALLAGTANASPLTPLPVSIGGAGISAVSFGLGVGEFAVVTYLIASGEHFPLCDVQGVSCAFTYPGSTQAEYVPATAHGRTGPHHVTVDGVDTIRNDGF